jgi:hypothetical protein
MTVALRAGPVLAATINVTLAEPTPEAAPERVIQLGRAEIVQGQEAAVWMLTVRLPLAAGNCNDVGATE